MKKVFLNFFLLFSVFANANVIDSAKVSQLINSGSKAFCHILDINEKAISKNKKERMQFVIEVPGNYVRTELHGSPDSTRTNGLTQPIKDSANAQLRRIYLEYGIELYVIIINSLDVIIKDTIKDGFTTQSFFHSKFFDSLSNVNALKAEHTSITDRIIAQSISTLNRDCLILSDASYCGAFFPGKNKLCLELEVLSSHSSATATYPQLSALKQMLLTRMRQNYISTAVNANFSLPASVNEFAESAKFIRLKGTIRQTFTPALLDAIFAQFNEEIDYEALGIDDRVHAISVYSGSAMSGDWFGNTGQETHAINILQHTPPAQVHDLLYYLEQPNALKSNPQYTGDQTDDALIKKLIDHTDDAVMSADNNYTKLVQVITQLMLSSQQEFEAHKPAETDNWLDRIFYWDDSYLFSNETPIGTHSYDVEWVNGGSVSIKKKIVDGRTAEYVAVENHYIYNPHWDASYAPVVLRPFDLIFFTNRSTYGMLQCAGATKGDVFIAPAIFLKYADDKTFNANTLKNSVIALDVVAVALGPGAILGAVEAGNYALCAFEATQFLGSAASLSLNAITDPELHALVEKYNMIVAVWGISRIVNAGTKFTVNYFTEAAAGGFQRVPAATAREFETAFQQAGAKVEQLSAEMKGKVKNMEEYLKGKVGVVNSLVNDVSFAEFINTVDDFKNGANAQLAQQSYTLWKEHRWGELEQLFTSHNLNGGWPPFNGFISKTEKTLEIGEEFDRYGGKFVNNQFVDDGKFAAPKNVPFGERALPESYLTTREHKLYRVIKVLPDVKEGNALPWFNQSGMGKQYLLPLTIDELIDQGYIIRIN